jgi:erythromycin esterase-like protein
MASIMDARSSRASVEETLRRHAQPITGGAAAYDGLLDRIGDAPFVLLGEASHGTHEFYRERARITRRLIEKKDFRIVAVEADWPDAYRVDRYVRGASADAEAVEALADFKRFPAWMWRNADVLDFIGWLRERNDTVAEDDRAGFYGLDLYSLHASIEAIVRYLERVDPAAAARARQRYGCFDHAGGDSQMYGYATARGLRESCEDEVVAQLLDLRRRAADYARADGRVAAEAFFAAEQNARLVRNAEQYYRAMFRGRDDSWNLRDTHMAETLEALVARFDRPERRAKAVVWAHNSHLGDARATAMGERGELNVGQIVRERHGTAAMLVGFTTYTGTVTAGSDWGAPAERKRVRPALPGSWESLFHHVGIARFVLAWRTDRTLADALADPRLERAIGVIYLPQTERASHYFRARLGRQFDAVIHIDDTRAVEPLERTAGWERGELPETYPHAV